MLDSTSLGCDDVTQPHLTVVKPGRKDSVKNASEFESLISEHKDSAFPLHIDTILDGVYVIDNVLSEKECNQLCSQVNNSDALAFWNAEGRSSESARMFRDADTVEVHSTTIASILWRRVSELLTTSLVMKIEDDETDPNWEREMVGNWFPVAINHDLLFAKYPCYGSFAPHTDGRAVQDFNTRSLYSIIIFLNTIPPPNGGGTKFYNNSAVKNLVKRPRLGELVEDSDSCDTYWTAESAHLIAEVEPVAGRMLIFHQAYVHEGVPPINPYEKFILRTDVMSARVPPACDGPLDREAYKIFRTAEDLAEAGHIEEATPLFRKAFKMSPEMSRIMGQG